VTGRGEVGVPGVQLGVTVLLAALSPLLLPAEVVVLDPVEGPTVAAPTTVVSLVAELPADSVLWARRFGRRYVLRPGPVLRLRQPELHLPAITVSVDHAEQAAAVAARHRTTEEPR
jgi:hypothetical protein